MITHLLTSNVLLIELNNIVTVLLIVVFFFLVLLILGVRKSYKLKAENADYVKMNKESLAEWQK